MSKQQGQNKLNFEHVRRFWNYQNERFPLASYGILVGVIVLAGLGYAGVLRRADEFVELRAIVVTYLVVLGIFLQLRIADEFKDYADDLAFRPYRAVPRGLVTLGELAKLAYGVGIVQALLSIWIGMGLFACLVIIWGYMLLMRYEFGVERWLKARPVFYLLSHMVVMPLLFFYIIAADWWGTGTPITRYVWFLGAAYANGLVFEIGRKIRAPADEEVGVETYSYLWRPRTAVLVWLIALLCAAWLAIAAAATVDAGSLVALSVTVGLTVAAVLSIRFLRSPKPGRGKWFEWFASSWLLLVYAVLGIVPAIRWFVTG